MGVLVPNGSTTLTTPLAAPALSESTAMSRPRDDDLLARLNALKPSSVVLSPTLQAASVDVQVSRPATIEDSLADRLKALRSGAASLRGASPATSGPFQTRSEGLTAEIRDEVQVEHSDPIRDWQQQDGDDEDQNLDELLAEITSGDDWKLDPEDPQHINSLLDEAKHALPTTHEAQDTRDNKDIRKISSAQNHAPDKTQTADQKDRQDDEDAREYVQRVLAEIDLESKDLQHDVDEKETAFSSESPASAKNGLSETLDLPSTPSNIPQPKTDVESSQDDDLAARFSRLGFSLPTTPSNQPTSKKSPLSKSGNAKSNLPKYTDEDIESWCCICNDDGEVKCLGCDDDVYCSACWREGHGSGPGQERGHKAVQFVRKGGEMAD